MWFTYAAAAMLCFAGMQLLMKQLTQMGLAGPVILVFIFAIGTVLYLGHVVPARQPMSVTGRTLVLLVLAAILSYGGNFYMIRALSQAPNPGYAMAVVGLQALPVTLAGIFLFGAEITWLKATGVILSVAGVVLMMVDA